MNYLGQPVFLFPPNWVDAVERTVKFELRPEEIGYGVPHFTPTADWTVNAWSFEVLLSDAVAIAAFDAFTAAVTGRLDGFWLPVPAAAARITAGTSNTVFSVAAQSLADYWNARPDVYLFFTFADGEQAAAKIDSVVDAGATETVTLTSALPQTPDAGTRVQKLHFVRLAEDVEQGTFLAEGVQSREVKVVELPAEYEAAALGLQPIWLFRFWSPAPVNQEWCYTSFAAPVVSGNKLFQNYPINFSGLANTAELETDNLTIEARPDTDHPFSLFLPVPFSSVVFVEVSQVAYADLETQTRLFSGRVVQVQDHGSRLAATCESRLGFLRRKLPRYLKGASCQNRLYDPATCKAGRAPFETSVNVVSVAADTFPPTAVCTFLLPAFAGKFKAADYLAGGLFESGVGLSYEARTIVSSAWNEGAGQLTLTLNLPLYLTAPGAAAQIVAGCDHTAKMCKDRFDNYANFSGFVAIPPRNPALKAVNANPVSQGGK